MARYIVRLLSSLFIAGSLFGFYLTQSGAPVRVHIAAGIALITAFVIPAQFVGSIDDLERHWNSTFIMMPCGILLGEGLAFNPISKYEFDQIGYDLIALLTALIVGVLFTTYLLMLHMFIIWLTSRVFHLPERSNIL
jgi:uncharacterized membrane protein